MQGVVQDSGCVSTHDPQRCTRVAPVIDFHYSLVLRICVRTGVPRRSRGVIITLYSKVGCCLCDEAREALDEVAANTPFDLREIDILSDPALFERYRYRIPVILKDGHEIAEGRVSALDLAAALGGSR